MGQGEAGTSCTGGQRDRQTAAGQSPVFSLPHLVWNQGPIWGAPRDPAASRVLPSEAGSLRAVQGGRGQPSRDPAGCRPEQRRGGHRQAISSLSRDPRPRLSWRRGEGVSFTPDGGQKPLGQGRRGQAGSPPRGRKGDTTPESGHASTAEAPGAGPASRLVSASICRFVRTQREQAPLTPEEGARL